MFLRCSFENAMEALQTRFETLNLTSCALPSLNLQGAQIEGDVFLCREFKAKGEVRLSGTAIRGMLNCINGQFENEGGDALNAQGAHVAGNVFLCDGFAAKGEVNLVGAVIGGSLDCAKGHFANAAGKALFSQRLRVGQSFFFSGC